MGVVEDTLAAPRPDALMIVTFARQCLGHASHGPKAAPEFPVWTAGMGLIMSYQGSGRSALPALIASIRATRCTRGRQRSQPSVRTSRCCAQAASTYGRSRCSLSLSAARTGELFGWSRILVDEEALCVVNPNGLAARGADVMVDA